MINLKRRKRQASENAEIVLSAFLEGISNQEQIIELPERKVVIKNESELEAIIEKIETEVKNIASVMEPDWAIPIIIEIIGKLYYGKFKEYSFSGPFFKRALAYLWDNLYKQHGEQKNIKQLTQLLFYCYVIEMLYSYKKMFFIIPEFYFSLENGYVDVPEEYEDIIYEFGYMLRGKGKRLRVAEVNSNLMLTKSVAFLEGLLSVLDGKCPKEIEVFKNTFYEMIPGIEDEECKKFWQELFLRYTFYIGALSQVKEDEDGTEVILFHEFGIEMPEGIITQEIVENMFWKKEWFQKKDKEIYSSLIVQRPILRISETGDFVTSAVVIGDSINDFVENQIFGYTGQVEMKLPKAVFKKAFSDPFEEKCIEYLRENGFIAGHILESGVWTTQNENIDLNIIEDKLFGEVDVFAYYPGTNVCFLIECKVLNDVRDTRSYRNIVAKLKDDSEEYRAKLRKKGAWIEKVLKVRNMNDIEVVKILLTDIPLPVINSDDDILLMDFYRLRGLIEYLLGNCGLLD